MGVKKDPSGRRSVQVEVEVPGSPEQVWEAIATGPGISSWFVSTEVGEDHTVVKDFGGGMKSSAKCTAWDPPHRYSTESKGWPPGAPPLATEWIVEAQSGGTCLVRVVHSLFASTDDWDNQLEGTESGWPGFFRVLKIYLTSFRGQPSALVQCSGMAAGSAAEVWSGLREALGVTAPGEGGRYRTAAGAPVLAGPLESESNGGRPHLILRLEEPAAGTAYLTACAMGAKVLVSASVYFYGEGAGSAAAGEDPKWSAWMKAFCAGQSGSR